MAIILNSPLSNHTSYGITGINLLIQLQKKTKVYAYPIGQRVDYFDYQTSIIEAIKNGEEDRNEWMGNPSVLLFHQDQLFSHISSKWRIGFPIFELDAFNKKELSSLSHCENWFVCTKWAANILAKELNVRIEDIGIVNLGVDSSIYYPTPLEYNKPFTFFYPGKFEYRKFHDGVMDVFERAFTSQDNIRIRFLPQNYFIKDNDEWIRFIMSSKLASKIEIVPRLETHKQVADLVRDSHCVVSFSRAEGWNLPLLEALSCGRNVVATNYSGHTEFLTRENSTLLEVSGRERAYDGVFFNGETGNWLSINEKDKDRFAEALRYQYESKLPLNTKGIETAKMFSWENSANQMLSFLGE